jgi:hypothetical protein
MHTLWIYRVAVLNSVVIMSHKFLERSLHDNGDGSDHPIRCILPLLRGAAKVPEPAKTARQGFRCYVHRHLTAQEKISHVPIRHDRHFNDFTRPFAFLFLNFQNRRYRSMLSICGAPEIIQSNINMLPR